ncbi:MAG: glycosyltransferase [Pseudomonadota bacterium]
MKFSIITPVLNGAAFLQAAIGSVQRQDHEELEHIVIDAGSSDGSLDIASDAARNDQRITVVRRPDEPLYQSILWGLDQAQGDVLSWLNSDDLYTPWALSTLADACAIDEPPQWLTGLPACWDQDGRLRYVRPEAWRPRALIKRGWFHKDLLGFIQQESTFFSSALYRKLTTAEKRSIAARRLAGDFALWKMLARHAPLTPVPSVLGGFRRHGANQSISGMDVYMAEVREIGAVFLPFPLRPLAQKTVRIVTALAASGAAASADERLRASQSGLFKSD